MDEHAGSSSFLDLGEHVQERSSASLLMRRAMLGDPALHIEDVRLQQQQQQLLLQERVAAEHLVGTPSPAAAAPARARSSGSKRTRAAEVHNQSEKRRRSRINEKMKALQSLIPNSNKTDKASMLDEAIEYLKQLQLQVQMLSMRNGLYLHPTYVPGRAYDQTEFAADMLSLDHSSAEHSYAVNPSSTNARQAHAVPAAGTVSIAEPCFNVGQSQTSHGSFQMQVSAEIFHDEMLPKHHLVLEEEKQCSPDCGMKAAHGLGTTDQVSEEQLQDIRERDAKGHVFMQQLGSVCGVNVD